jgi:hypothetical protein
MLKSLQEAYTRQDAAESAYATSCGRERGDILSAKTVIRVARDLQRRQ